VGNFFFFFYRKKEEIDKSEFLAGWQPIEQKHQQHKNYRADLQPLLFETFQSFKRTWLLHRSSWVFSPSGV
jgi:hypothetical protein